MPLGPSLRESSDSGMLIDRLNRRPADMLKLAPIGMDPLHGVSLSVDNDIETIFEECGGTKHSRLGTKTWPFVGFPRDFHCTTVIRPSAFFDANHDEEHKDSVCVLKHLD
ncbi:hypothetical protein CALVIDRAFT_60422 [Calocera viscosa TUFC12733]|uniref:Uncharacterized protein n=1 Tax=Calocera viscosa (strain TUFC12733) TaxID=1330018 RepID=A0A167NJI7_CALVF|nr:hypothetical protein CALVIDRAFT_60422 [Calocera viscosa TUFC12733]